MSEQNPPEPERPDEPVPPPSPQPMPYPSTGDEYPPAPYGAAPYGAGPYAGGPYAGGPDTGGPSTGGQGAFGALTPSAEAQSVRTQAIVSLIVNALSVLACCFTFLTLFSGVTGAVLAGLALSKANTDLAGAKGLVRWSWIALAIGVGGGIVLGIFARAIGTGIGWFGGF